MLVVEGQSDVSAAITLGLPAVGRPSAKVSGDSLSWLVDLLKRIPDGRDVIILGENDEKPGADGSPIWPGKAGAVDTAEKLSKHPVTGPGRRVGVALPPAGCKDFRSWRIPGRLVRISSKGWKR